MNQDEENLYNSIMKNPPGSLSEAIEALLSRHEGNELLIDKVAIRLAEYYNAKTLRR